MGISGKKWGPNAWVLIHSISATIDAIEQKHIRDIISIRFWKLLPNILPCYICRVSAKKYINIISNHCSYNNKQISYLLHEQVNLKLISQKYKENVLKHLYSYQPKFESLEYVNSNSLDFLNILITFLYHMARDFENNVSSMNDFLYILVFILHPRVGEVLHKSLLDNQMFSINDDILIRTSFVHTIEQMLLNAFGSKPCMSFKKRLSWMINL